MARAPWWAWGVLIAAGLIGYSARWAQDVVHEVDTAVLVDEERLTRVSAGDCTTTYTASGPEIRMAKAALGDNEAGFATMEIKPRDRSAQRTHVCAFDFAVPSDSYLQGAMAIRPISRGTTRIDFFSRLDAQLNHADRPTFSVWLIHGQGESFAFESFRSRLLRLGAGGRVNEVGSSTAPGER